MNTFQLECFLAVAEYLNFAQAAKKMNITQPAITHQIQSLEETLNVTLFKRTTRIVQITTEGKMFINDAKRILEISERAKQRFSTTDQNLPIPFIVGVQAFYHLFSLAPLLEEMKTLYPNIHPRLKTVPFAHFYQMLTEGDADILICFEEPNKKKAPGIYKELKKIPLVCLCSFDHPFAKKNHLTIEELKNNRLIINDPMISPEYLIQLQNQLIGTTKHENLYFCDSTEAALTLAQSNYGLAFLPDINLPHDIPLARIPIKDMPLLSFGLYYRSLNDHPYLKDFVRIAKAAFQK